MAALGWNFKVGHWTDPVGKTGCTVILPPPGNIASCDIRGSSPGSREIESLRAERRLNEIHGVLLTGGSAFGLDAAGGVMSWLEERGVGFRTPPALVPIVPTAVVFDLGAGDASARPGPQAGRDACDAAHEGDIATGLVGAGAGCTVGKWAGREHAVAGGVGVSEATENGARVAAIAIVNALGDVVGEDGTVLAGTTAAEPRFLPPPGTQPEVTGNTVLALVATSAAIDKRDARFLAERGSDGITVAVRPAHTRYDGDIVFSVTAPPEPGAPPASVDLLGYLATKAVAAAVRDAVAATSTERSQFDPVTRR
ncbi:MAG: P1 family peptidase [Actinomycetota bacterium]